MEEYFAALHASRKPDRESFVAGHAFATLHPNLVARARGFPLPWATRFYHLPHWRG
jgi:hypothetical protein